MYEFVAGPLLWISFAVFLGGLAWRIVWYIRGLDWQADRVAYREYPKEGALGVIKSFFFWLLPFGSRSWRMNPGMTIMFFLFHIGLIFVPLFLAGHNILFESYWGFSLPMMSDALADTLTLLMLIAAVFLVLRRIALPEVRILTTAYDYLLLAVTVAPFFTGFIVANTAAGAKGWMIAHIVTGEIMLVMIPFTKLSHFALFFLSRAQIGLDFAIKRGGMKGRGISW